MKKNLFYKNINFIGKKFRLFDHLFLKKSILRNFRIPVNHRLRFGFLSQSILNKKGSIFVVNTRAQCLLTWRTGSVYSFFKLTRLTLRENFSFGFVKGLRKSSW